ncbi:MAG: hypothetical protein HFI70_06835 [Lachnospiraceae bacterium]|nr:hypothetical protein [Lachnospiraceae bacterium]
MREESAVNDYDLEFVEIAEFIRSDNRKEILRYKEQERRRKRNFYRLLTVFLIVFLTAVLLGVFAFHLSLPLICTVLILEAAIAVCLYHAPVWVHVLEIMIGISAGIVFGQPCLLVAGALVYLAAILAWTGVENFIFWQ